MAKIVPGHVTIELVIQNITMRKLFKALFEKYAPEFSGGVNWRSVLASSDSTVLSKKMTDLSLKLRSSNIRQHAEICGAFMIIGAAAKSAKIRKACQSFTEKDEVAKKLFNVDMMTMSTGYEGNLSDPVNRVTWICIKKEIESQWTTIVQMVTAEQQSRISWTYFEISQASNTTDETITTGRQLFEDKMVAYFADRKPIPFAVEILPLLRTATFERYIVSTTRDPMVTRVIRENHVENGYDNTANCFLIDHFFLSNYIRVEFPDVTTEDVIAEHFAKYVLNCELNRESTSYYTAALQQFTNKENCRKLLSLSTSEKKVIKSLRIESIMFSCLEDETTADRRMKLLANPWDKRVRP